MSAQPTITWTQAAASHIAHLSFTSLGMTYQVRAEVTRRAPGVYWTTISLLGTDQRRVKIQGSEADALDAAAGHLVDVWRELQARRAELIAQAQA